jgi:hypothetical protein
MGEETGTQGTLEFTWSHDELESLIENVRERRILYDTISKENKNAGKKELEWLNVSQALGKDGKPIKIRMNNLVIIVHNQLL